MSDKKDGSTFPILLCSETEKGERGQIDFRLLLGAIVLIVIAGPLAAAATEIQSSLASTPMFSWFSAAVIALLIVAAIAAAALGLD
jgi:hypothetical protein